MNNANATGQDLVAMDSNGIGQGNDNLDPTPHFVFGVSTVTWEGDTDSDWEDNTNWDTGG